MTDPAAIDATLSALTDEEQRYTVDVICRWIEADLTASGRRAPR